MSNPYYQFSSPVVPGTTIRADKYNFDQQAVETAFDNISEQLDGAIFLPDNFTGNRNIAPQAVENTFIFINNDGDADLYPVGTLLAQFSAVENRYTQIQAWYPQIASSVSSTLANAEKAENYAIYPENQMIPGTSDYSAKHWAKQAEVTVTGGVGITSVASNTTAIRLARVSEYVVDTDADCTITIDESTFSANERLKLVKPLWGGRLTFSSGQLITMPDGTEELSHDIPDSYAATVELTFRPDGSATARLY